MRALPVDLARLLEVAERARGRQRLSPEDLAFVREVVPAALMRFPRIALPTRLQHPEGFSVSGAPVRTYLRSALLMAGQKALGKRYGGSEFYERTEKDFAFGIMRSHFHHGHPKGTYCCAQCTLAVYPVLELGAIRYFDCAELARVVKRVITKKQWRFSRRVNPAMLAWALRSGD